MNSLLIGLAVGLSVTLVTELPAAALLRVRGWDLVLIGLVNCVTNPVVNLIYVWSLLTFSRYSAVPYLILAALEISVVFGEAWAFRLILHYRRSRPFLLSLIPNGVSFSVGLILNFIF